MSEDTLKKIDSRLKTLIELKVQELQHLQALVNLKIIERAEDYADRFDARGNNEFVKNEIKNVVKEVYKDHRKGE